MKKLVLINLIFLGVQGFVFAQANQVVSVDEVAVLEGKVDCVKGPVDLVGGGKTVINGRRGTGGVN